MAVTQIPVKVLQDYLNFDISVLTKDRFQGM